MVVHDISIVGKLRSFLDAIAHLFPNGAKITKCDKKDKLKLFSSGIYVYPLAFLVGFAIPLNPLLFEVLKQSWDKLL